VAGSLISEVSRIFTSQRSNLPKPSHGALVTLALVVATFSFVIGLFTLSVVGGRSEYDPPKNLRNMILDVRQSVVTVYCGNDQGSGWAYRNERTRQGTSTIVVTNFHVLENCVDGGTPALTIVHGNTNESIAGEVTGHDEPNDLALVRVDTYIKPLETAPSFAEPGWWAMAMGTPGVEGESLVGSVSIGNVVNMSDGYLIFTTALINPGNSGGPLINNRGQVMGINSFVIRNNPENNQFWNLAIDTGILCDQLVECP
jgi:S1-C subfamily serine protease